jgi:8-oxo-dGTP pyrophosphatase MutT (NUDIX family)
MNFDEFVISVSKIKNIPLPAEASQFKMSPPFRRELMKQQREKMKNPNKAGVLALFYPDQTRQTNLVLILRNTYKGVHSGQVGFPGGKLELGDNSLKEAAIRETYEEIGIPIDHIEVVKELTELYIPPSNFYVKPYLGITSETPNFIPDESEVQEIIEVLLNHFIDDNNVITKSVSTSYNVEIEVPAFLLNDHVVWGATAMMMSEIKDLLRQVL